MVPVQFDSESVVQNLIRFPSLAQGSISLLSWFRTFPFRVVCNVFQIRTVHFPERSIFFFECIAIFVILNDYVKRFSFVPPLCKKSQPKNSVAVILDK